MPRQRPRRRSRSSFGESSLRADFEYGGLSRADLEAVAAVRGLQVVNFFAACEAKDALDRCGHVLVEAVREFNNDDSALARCAKEPAHNCTAGLAPNFAKYNLHTTTLAHGIGGAKGNRSLCKTVGSRGCLKPGAFRPYTAHVVHITHGETGWIEVVCGPMFSGKSEELIRRLRRAQIARQPLQVFKPKIDDRYHATKIVSHSSQAIEATIASSSQEIAEAIRSDTRVVGIDEVQFFDKGIVELCERLAARGMRVVVAGLDQDYTGAPFEPMPQLMAVAEYVTKALAICSRCGAPAGRSQRLLGGDTVVAVGAAESYEARCRRCHVPRIEATTGELFGDKK